MFLQNPLTTQSRINTSKGFWQHLFVLLAFLRYTNEKGRKFVNGSFAKTTKIELQRKQLYIFLC